MNLNIDESGIRRGARKPLVVSEIGKAAPPIIKDDEKEFVTLVATCTDSGHLLPGLCIFKLGPKTDASAFEIDRIRVGQTIAFVAWSVTGWITEELWVWYLKKLRACFPIDTPLQFTFDSYSVHTSAAAESWYRDEQLSHVYIPPKLTALVQPLDVSVFGPFKARLASIFRDLQKPLNQIIAKERRAIILCAIEIAMDCTTLSEVLTGWRDSGLAASRAVRSPSEPVPTPVEFKFGVYTATTPAIAEQQVAAETIELPVKLRRPVFSLEQRNAAVAALKAIVNKATSTHVPGTAGMRAARTTLAELNKDPDKEFLWHAPQPTAVSSSSSSSSSANTASKPATTASAISATAAPVTKPPIVLPPIPTCHCADHLPHDGPPLIATVNAALAARNVPTGSAHGTVFQTSSTGEPHRVSTRKRKRPARQRFEDTAYADLTS